MAFAFSKRLVASLRVNRYGILLLLILGASLGLNVYLSLRIDVLGRYAPPPGRQLVAGMEVPSILGQELDGRRVTIDWSTDPRATVLYVFSAGCVWCSRNLANVKALIDARQSDYRFIGLSMSEVGLTDFVSKNKLSFRTYKGVDAGTARKIGLGATPQTLVISPQGRVLKSWRGAYTGTVQEEVEAYFKVGNEVIKEAP